MKKHRIDENNPFAGTFGSLGVSQNVNRLCLRSVRPVCVFAIKFMYSVDVADHKKVENENKNEPLGLF